MNKKKILILTGVILIIAALVVVSIVSRNKDRPVEVTAYKVVPQDFIHEVSANGDISSRENTRIYSAVSAAVDEVLVSEGDFVKRGDILIRLDQESLENNLINAENAVINARMSVRAELLNLRSAYSSALTGYAQTEREWKRISELHKIGSVSNEELKLVEEQLLIAEENLESSRQKLNFREGRELDDNRESFFKTDRDIVESSPEVTKALGDYDIGRKNLKYYEIRAESSGTLTALNVDSNSVVELGVMMAEIYNEDQIIVEAMIDEVDLSYIKTEQEVKITSDSFIGTELPGKVSRIAPIIRKVGDTRVCEIEVDLLENPDRIARIGASASIFIIVDERLQKPAIPVESYFMEDNRKYVFLLHPSEGEDPDTPEYFTAVKQEIETGILDIETIEATSGISNGDLILSGRVPGIEDGTEVILAEDKEKEDKE